LRRRNTAGEKNDELEHDPEKWEPVFGKDHAPTISWSGMTIRRKVIPLQAVLPVCRDRTISGAKILWRAMNLLGGCVEATRASRTTAIRWALRNTMEAVPHSF
jgi:hypothetical protein